MRYSVKEAVALAAVVSCLSLFVFLLLVTTNTIINVSAVEANGIGVYWDSNCSNKVSSIDWGTLGAGSVKNVVVFIRNEVEDSAYLLLSTTNWNPPEASQFFSLGWNYSGQQTNPDETIQTTLTLSVSRFIEGISDFSHDITITASDSFPGDINDDGIVDIYEVVKVALAFGSQREDNPETPQDESENWNTSADISPPYDIVDIYDVAAVTLHFGETGT